MEIRFSPPSYWELVELVESRGRFAATACFRTPLRPLKVSKSSKNLNKSERLGFLCFYLCRLNKCDKKNTQKITGIDVHGILSNDLLVFIRILFHPYQVGWRIRPLNVGEISTSSHGPLWGPQICWDVEMGQRSTKLWQVTSGFNKKTRRKVVVKSKWDIFF